MEFRQRSIGDEVVFLLKGDGAIGETGAVSLTDAVNTALQQGRHRIVLDLAHLRHMDSADLGQLTQVNSLVRASGGRLQLANISKRLENLLVISKILATFDCRRAAEDKRSSAPSIVERRLLPNVSGRCL